jgi:hypothetical protein
MSDGPERDTERSVPLVGPVVDLAQEALVNLGDLLPRLVDRSRRQADFLLAVVERLRCGSVREPASEMSDAHEPHSANGAHRATSAGSNGSTADSGGRPVLVAVPDPTPEPDAIPAPDAATLSIPDYDSLAASQVLPRLDGLTTDELEAIRAYEAAHRNRRTILGRLSQLLV